MSLLLNPRSSPAVTILMCAIALCSAGFFSADRIATALSEKQRDDLGESRAKQCRILPQNEKIVLGGYYFQPTGATAEGGLTGNLLDEGIYVCDRYGGSGRIERGGYLQFPNQVMTPESVNKTLKERLEDPANPDHDPNYQVRIAPNLGIYQPPVQTEKPKDFFAN